MKKWAVLLFVIGLLFPIGVYLFSQRNKTKSPPGLIYNTYTKTWETGGQEPHIVREDLAKISNEDGLHNNSLLRGYFDHYDPEKQILIIKAVMPFTNANKFELVDLELSTRQTIYCAPKDYVDPNTGKTYLTKSLTFPVKDGEVVYVPTEQTTNFDNFLSKSNDLTYLLIQLTKDFDPANKNYVQKIIALEICD